ncbi:MAG: hypothetical protein U0168_13655 [Nannocystaceae bacterium]
MLPLLVALVAGACSVPAMEQTPAPTLVQQVYTAAAPAGAGWSFNGGDGTRFGDANAACAAFADSYGQGLAVDHLESTASAGTKRCWVKAPQDKTASQMTLVTLEGEASAVALADAGGLADVEAALRGIARDCEAEVGQPVGQQSCAELGRQKHQCAAAAIERALALQDGPPSIYSGPAFDRAGNMFGKLNPDGAVPPRVPRTEAAIEAEAVGFFNSGNSGFATLAQAIAAAKRGKLFPDVVVPSDPSQRLERGNVAAIYDFKFPCPPDKPAVWGYSNGSRKRQDRAYNDALHPSQGAVRIQPG